MPETKGASLKMKKPRRGESRQGFGVVINLEVNHQMNAIAITPENNLSDATTPEEVFAVPFRMPLNVDVMLTILSRSQALLHLIQSSGSGDAFLSHSDTMNGLWLLEGQLSQLQQLLRNAETA